MGCFCIQISIKNYFVYTFSFKNAGVNGTVLRELRRALDKEPKLLEHIMERPLDLLRALRLTASLRTLPLTRP